MKYRLDLAPDPESARPYEALISNDGGEHEIALSLHDRTYFEPKTPDVTSSLLHLLPIEGDRSVSGVMMTVLSQPETVSGAPSQRHQIKLSYDITLVIPPPPDMHDGFKGRSETVRGKVSIDAVYWMAEGKIPVLPQLLRPRLHTGFSEADAKLDRALAALQGVPVKQRVTISTQGNQGTAPQASTRTVTLENHQTRKTKASLFEVPAGFKMHEPELSRPGLGPVPPGYRFSRKINPVRDRPLPVGVTVPAAVLGKQHVVAPGAQSLRQPAVGIQQARAVTSRGPGLQGADVEVEAQGEPRA